MFGFLAGLNLKLVAIACALVVVFGAGWTANGWRLNSKIEAEHLAMSQQLLQVQQENQQKELAMQQQADTIRRAKDAQINSINTKLANALDELRKRPSRDDAPTPAPSSQSACTGQTSSGATGAQLYREDADFLIGEAARAEALKVALQACYQQYDKVTQ